MKPIIQLIEEDALKVHIEQNNISEFFTNLVKQIKSIGKNDGGRITTNTEAIKVLRQFKKNSELLSDAYKYNEDIQLKVNNEINILNKYLPPVMDEHQLEAIIATYIEHCVEHEVPCDIGSIMRYLEVSYNHLYDGKLAQEITKRLLKINA